MAKKLNTQEFIEKVKLVHNDKYDYTMVNYINTTTKINIICKEHGIFSQRPDGHTQGRGCPKCVFFVTDTESFVEKANFIHNWLYDYSICKYTNGKNVINIICKIHGEFSQITRNHLQGQGCPKCGGSVKSNTEEFIEKTKLIHGDLYDYSKSEYITAIKEVDIICKTHGIFRQTPNNHLSGQGCPKCGGYIKLTNEEFIKRAINIHGNLYNYDKVDYKDIFSKVIITCKKHGDFIQTACDHINNGSGCQMCNYSKGEKLISNFLKENNINFIPQKKFDGCKSKKKLPFDFYLPDYNMCIEYDGKQHFEVREFFGGLEAFEITKAHDKIKTDYCINNNITLIRIPYFEYNVIEELLTNKIMTKLYLTK